MFTPLNFESLILHPSSFFKIRLITLIERIEPLILLQYKVKSLGVLVLTLVYNLPFVLLPAPGCIYILKDSADLKDPTHRRYKAFEKGTGLQILFITLYILL